MKTPCGNCASLHAVFQGTDKPWRENCPDCHGSGFVASEDTPPVQLSSSWAEILGAGPQDFPEPQRKQRWEDWLALADSQHREHWTDTEACAGCIHLSGHWCTLMGLPCTVNPILTMRHSQIGMACGGASHEIKPEQLTLL